jgi:hypothetical protein
MKLYDFMSHHGKVVARHYNSYTAQSADYTRMFYTDTYSILF